MPLKAHIIANRPGHSSNVDFAKKIKQYIKKNKHVKDIPVYDPNQPPIYYIAADRKNPTSPLSFFTGDKIIELTDKHIVVLRM